MAKSTRGVKKLVGGALNQLSKLQVEDIILLAFIVVQNDPNLRSCYDAEKGSLGDQLTNQWFGRYVRNSVGGKRLRQVKACGTNLAKTYAKLEF